MKNSFMREQEGIYRLRVPFEELYTSVFLVVTPQRLILVDCATTDDDVEHCIIPALKEMGRELCDIDAIRPGASAVGAPSNYKIHSRPVTAVTAFIANDNGFVFGYRNAWYSVEVISVLGIFFKIYLLHIFSPLPVIWAYHSACK